MRLLSATSALLLCLIAGAVLVSGSRPPDDDFYAMRKNFELFGSVYEQLVGTYVSRIDPERFVRTGVDEMLGTLDPWTVFYDEADNVEIDLRNRRLLGDVGLNLGRRDGRIAVLVPDEAASAYRQGVRTGDVVVRVGGQPVDSLAVPDVQELLRGEPGSVVEVVFEREGTGELTFQLRREASSSRSVSMAERLPAPADGIVYLKLDRFGAGAARELAEGLEQARGSGPVEGIILDMRNNPGGLLSQAIAVSRLFLPKGSLVVSTRGRAPESNRAYHTEDEPLAPDAPLVVLMNGYSASASEIVAGAMQDHDRGVIIGSASFGKGLVQVYRRMPYNTSLKLTMARYYTPSGRGIRKDALEVSGQASVDSFRTGTGRTVREGYGVEPEIVIEPPPTGPLEDALQREAAFFLYAGILAAESGEAIEAAARGGRTVSLPDDTMDRFRAWLDARDFDFETPFERSLDDIDLDGRNRDVRQAWDRLREAARAERASAFDVERARLLYRLTDEVSTRILGPSEQVRLALADDPAMAEATALLDDAGRYASLLRPR